MKLTTENNVFIVSVIVKSNCHILQFLHQMFNVSALLLDDALKPATPLSPMVPIFGPPSISESDVRGHSSSHYVNVTTRKQ